MRVIVVGSLNVDLCVDVDRLPSAGETVLGRALRRHAGGKGLNQAIAAARQGAPVTVVGCLGDDEGGRWLRDLLAVEGIDGSRIRAAAPGVATGTALVTVDAAGIGQITVAPGANAEVTAARVEADLAGLAPAAGDVVLVQLEIPLDAAAAAIRSAGRATTILNPAPAVRLDGALLGVDVLVPNEHEVTATGLGRGHTVVTLGAAGARWHHDDAVVDVAPFAVDAVDSTGAGDAFCGTLAAALAAGEGMPGALRRASAAAALAVTRPGAAEAMPSAAEVDALLRQRP